MRFEIWLYKRDNHVSMCLRDTTMPLHRAGSVLLRNQSSYPEDGGRMIWSRAAYPSSVWFVVEESGGFKIAEGDVNMFDANLNWKILNYLWDNHVHPEEAKS